MVIQLLQQVVKKTQRGDVFVICFERFWCAEIEWWETHLRDWKENYGECTLMMQSYRNPIVFWPEEETNFPRSNHHIHMSDNMFHGVCHLSVFNTQTATRSWKLLHSKQNPSLEFYFLHSSSFPSTAWITEDQWPFLSSFTAEKEHHNTKQNKTHLDLKKKKKKLVEGRQGMWQNQGVWSSAWFGKVLFLTFLELSPIWILRSWDLEKQKQVASD